MFFSFVFHFLVGIIIICFFFSFSLVHRKRRLGFRIQFCPSFRVCQINPKSLALGAGGERGASQGASKVGTKGRASRKGLQGEEGGLQGGRGGEGGEG